MPQFSYKARDAKGQPQSGTMEAESRAAVIARLQQLELFPILVKQGDRTSAKGASKSAPVATAATPHTGNTITRMLPKLGFGGSAEESKTAKRSTVLVKKPGGKPSANVKPKAKDAAAESSGISFRSRRIKMADVASFNRQLADLLGAGIALVKSLTILQKQTPNAAFKAIISEINTDVQGGATFADALAKHPEQFSKLYVAMVRSGEAGGMLDEVLNRLADFSEAEEQLKSRVKSALAYPVVMMIAGSAAVAVMFTYVVPKIVSTFENLNQTLPPMTQVLITISKFSQQYWYVVLIALAAMIIGAWQFVRSAEGRKIWHRIQLKLPLMGDVVRKREVARFARTLGSLLKNGVSILQALAITREVLNNDLVKYEVDKIIDEITQGASIAEPLRNSIIFPAVTVNMMSVGEETGQLETVLLRISDSYEMEVDRKVRTLTSLIEPLIIVLMGFVVGFIVIAMLLPIFSLDPSGGV